MPSGKGSEAQLQRDVVKACKARWPGIAIMASASGAHLAGGRRSGRMMKLSGVEVGDPDLNIREWGRNGEPSAYVELKVPGGVVSDAQRRQHGALRDRGHAVFVLYSVAEFMSTIAEYLPPDFDASDPTGNAARGAAAAAAALGLRADQQLDADGGGQHSERMAPADNGSSTDGPGAPEPGSSEDAPIEIDLEPELSGAGAESEGGGREGSMPPNSTSTPAMGTWAYVLLGAGEAAGEAEVPPETEVDQQWAWEQEADWNDDGWAAGAANYGYDNVVDLDDEFSGDGYNTS